MRSLMVLAVCSMLAVPAFASTSTSRASSVLPGASMTHMKMSKQMKAKKKKSKGKKKKKH